MSEAYSPIVRGFDAETAELDTCRIEHDLSRETFEKFKACWETIAKGERKP
jgi:Mn-dependent DtxR family transcriptional regulator